MSNKKRVVMTLSCDIFPVAAGHHKAMYEIAKYLHGLKNVSLELLVFSQTALQHPESYMDICDQMRWVPIPRSWSFIDIVNKIVIRLLPIVYQNAIWARSMRKAISESIEAADFILVNFPFWYPVVPAKDRKEKAVVITVDLFFYRLASFMGNKTFFQKLRVAVNRFFELHVLKSFNKIGVFAQYEEDLLVKHGVAKECILKLGMPVKGHPSPVERRYEYDFITIGSNIVQNVEGVECFLTRVTPLLDATRQYKLAVAGSLSKNSIWDSNLVPENFEIIKLGYVEDLAVPCAKARVGIGTPTHGSGVKVKVVEMIMNDLPVVVTDSGAEGIPMLENGFINIDKATPTDIANRVQGWLDEPDSTVRIGRAQGAYLRECFSAKNCLGCLSDVIGEIGG